MRLYNNWKLLAVLVISVTVSAVTALLVEYRFFAHNFNIKIIDYIGYGYHAFRFVFIIAFFSFCLVLIIITGLKRVRGRLPLSLLLSIIIIVLPLCMGSIWLYNKNLAYVEPNLSMSTPVIVFTFDTEEDWSYNESFKGYYDSYKYITSGAFNQLIDGMHERNVSATFYITPNLAESMPDTIRYIEMRGFNIGVHLHPHNYVSVNYPYASPYNDTRGDNLHEYTYNEKKHMMKYAKKVVGESVGHEISLFRSGRLSCDREIECIANELGFRGIANHRGIYYIEPLDIWNVGVGAVDLFDSKYCNSFEDYQRVYYHEIGRQNIIVFSAHPMLLYNHTNGDVDEEKLNEFLRFIDWLNEQNVTIIDQESLLNAVEKQ